MTYTFKNIDWGKMHRIRKAAIKAAEQRAAAEKQRKEKSKAGRKSKNRPGPATVKHIQEVYKDLKTNYPHGIFAQIGREFTPNSREKRNCPPMATYFAYPEKYSIDIWHRIFKAIAVVKARY